MNRKTIVSVCLAAALSVALFVVVPMLKADDAPKAADVSAAKGSCVFGGKTSTWSATLTASDTPGVYTASYTAAWGSNKAMTYSGTIKTDWKGDISGTGKSTGGGGNGSFTFTGKFGADGVANCSYTEVGGRRSGTLTVENPNK